MLEDAHMCMHMHMHMCMLQASVRDADAQQRRRRLTVPRHAHARGVTRSDARHPFCLCPFYSAQGMDLAWT